MQLDPQGVINERKVDKKNPLIMVLIITIGIMFLCV